MLRSFIENRAVWCFSSSRSSSSNRERRDRYSKGGAIAGTAIGGTVGGKVAKGFGSTVGGMAGASVGGKIGGAVADITSGRGTNPGTPNSTGRVDVGGRTINPHM